MIVQINLESPFEYTTGDSTPSFGFCGNLVIAVDPGKTNMAMVVGTPGGTRLAILQFRAPGRSYDNSTYCHDFKSFLLDFLGQGTVVKFGIEAAISKRGMNHHQSSMVLTEIRANLIDLSLQMTGTKPQEINNWSWKAAILPDGMRSQSEKGSIRFLPDLYALYGNADVTDAVCMFEYVTRRGAAEWYVIPSKAEPPLSKFSMRILSKMSARTSRRFSYTPSLSVRDNCIYYINRTWEIGHMIVPVAAFTLQEIYGTYVLYSKEYAEHVIVEVMRC